jgi:hypothetical protein
MSRLTGPFVFTQFIDILVHVENMIDEQVTELFDNERTRLTRDNRNDRFD